MSMGRARGADRRPRVGFVMEQALGHVTYSRNLQSSFAAIDRIDARWLPVPFADGGPLDRIPRIRSNWTARASLRAAGLLRAAGGPRRFDALVLHTQSVALAAPLLRYAAPVILSLDATPLNFDRVGRYYGHHARPESRVERVKQQLYRRVFRSSARIVAWSHWARDSLAADYGVDPDLVAVIPPGVELPAFDFGRQRPPRRPGPVRVLFVGGDFARKGGPLLLSCLRDGLAGDCELHLVTSEPLPAAPGVSVYTGVTPNSPELLALYRDADVFALPTYADCLAVVLGEAMAAGLPVVTTSVAAQPENVLDGRSGLIVPPGDAAALGAALRRLVADEALRLRMGREGRAIAEARYDARVNAERLTAVIEDGIERWRRERRSRGPAALVRRAA